jgi:non-specific serine/threonine protein kinase
MQPSNHSAYEFGEFRFEPDEARLSRAGDTVNLEPKAIAVLGEMVTRPGHLHARDDLLDAVWGHRHVTPSTLNRIVTMLRQALGDDRTAPRFIETVPRLGYRFIAEVHATPDEATDGRRHGDVLFRPQPLPARIESEIPREAELATLQGLLRDARLLTVLGPGGIGKTALALEVARRSVEAFADGVWLVDLTPCRNEDDIGDLLLATFGLAKQGSDWEKRLVAALQPRNLLLLLDNCERAAEPCAALAEVLLQRCPGVRILATSQVRLGMEGEQDYRVPPLSLPGEGWERSADPLASARGSEAVRLLELRAREADPLFELDADNIAAVVALCRHLDGLPLALELAASRLRVLGPDELLERLEARREVLVADWQRGPDRQRTVRDMLDWSFHLLSEEEAQLLQRLALFSGGWTLEGAEAVMCDNGGGRDVVGPLGSLVDKSFVAVEHHAKPRRFRMLETVRQYALERLEADPQANAYRRRHLQHFLAVTARADALLYDEPMHWYGRWLDLEQANLRMAFEFALAQGLAEDALALALNLRWHWWQQGHLQRAQVWIQQALAANPAASPVARAQALQFIGLMALHLGEETAEAMLVEAVAATAQVGLRREHGLALAALAMVRVIAGRCAEARRMLSRTMREAIATGDAQMLGYALIWVTAMHSSLGRHRLGLVAARCACNKLATFWRARGSAPGFLYGFAQVNLGLQAYFLGDMHAAARAFDAALALATTLRNLRMSAAALEGFGYVLQQQGQPALAARILGNAQGLRELTAVPMSKHWQVAHGKVWRTLQRELGDEAEILFETGLRERQDALHAELRKAYPALGLAPAAVTH